MVAPRVGVWWGDVFGNGRCFAFVAEDGVKVAEFRKGRWQPVVQWDVPVAWVPPGSTAVAEGFYHLAPKPGATPFEPADLDGDAVPELLVPFNNDGYSLGYRIVRWDARAGVPRLLEVSSGRGRPERRQGMLITFEGSGRKAWWSERWYHEWREGTPVPVAVWRSDQTDPEQGFVEGARCDSRGEFRSGYRVCAGAVTRVKEKGGVDQRTVAHVNVSWKSVRGGANLRNEAGAEELFWFTRMTGLPWRSYGRDINGGTVEAAHALWPGFTVSVTGDAEVVRLFRKD